VRLDNDVVRDLLLTIEREQDSPDVQLPIGDKDYPRFYAAAQKLEEAGLIEAEWVPDAETDEEYWVITELTEDGHEFLDTVRDPAIWKKTKAVAKKGGAATVDAVFTIAKEILKAEIKKHTGFL
jgi:DNA-binding PadR family transcriptional regulator